MFVSKEFKFLGKGLSHKISDWTKWLMQKRERERSFSMKRKVGQSSQVKKMKLKSSYEFNL